MNRPQSLPVIARPVAGLLVLLLAFVLAALPTRAASSPPDRMSYQGYLVDGTGHILAPTTPANYPVVFRIYDESDGGNLVWSEQQVVTVDKGYFSVVLGEGSAVSGEPHGSLAEVFTQSGATSRYMSTTVTVGGSAVTLLPRLRLLSSPYAFLATQATRLVNPSSGAPFLSVAAGTVSIDGAVQASGAVNAASGTFGGSVSAGSFVGNGTIPLGGIIMWSGAINAIPAGWALCNGQAVNGLQTPDLRDRFVVGAGSSYAVGSTGGQALVTLSVAQMPAHSHTYLDTWWAEYDGWDSTFGRTAGSNRGTDWDNYMFGGNRTSASTGGNQPFENRPPYYALAYIMRVN